MARKPPPRTSEITRKNGVSINLCGWVNVETGEWCDKQGTFGLGPPMYPTEEHRCLTHRWPDYFEKERQWNT